MKISKVSIPLKMSGHVQLHVLHKGSELDLLPHPHERVGMPATWGANPAGGSGSPISTGLASVQSLSERRFGSCGGFGGGDPHLAAVSPTLQLSALNPGSW